MSEQSPKPQRIMASKWKAAKLVSEQTDIKKLIKSSNSDRDMNWSSGNEMDSESESDLVDSDHKRPH